MKFKANELLRYFESITFIADCTGDSHLHFEVGPDGSCGQPRFWTQCPSLWSGCRLTHGMLQGRVAFEVRLERKLLPTQLEEQEIMEPYGLRVGWSVADASLMLGEDWVNYYVYLLLYPKTKLF